MTLPDRLAFAAVLALSFTAAACAPPEAKEPEYRGQSYRDAIRTMCNADEMAGLSQENDPLEKASKREVWLNEHVENPDAIYLRTMLKVKSASERAAALCGEAAANGIRDCPLVDTITAEAM